MLPTTLTSELDAVNMMLSIAGEAPVNSIIGTGLGDVAVAVQCLTEASRMVQEKGWTFNTDYEYELVPDATTKQIVLPTNVLRCEFTDKFTYDVTVRGQVVYDRYNKTYEFPSVTSIKATIVWFMPFEMMPQAARQAIAIKASRIFQRRVFGDSSMNGYTQEEEYQAFSSLQDQDCDVGDYNIFSYANYDTARILERY